MMNMVGMPSPEASIEQAQRAVDALKPHADKAKATMDAEEKAAWQTIQEICAIIFSRKDIDLTDTLAAVMLGEVRGRLRNIDLAQNVLLRWEQATAALTKAYQRQERAHGRSTDE
jgi:hypothetical protein